MFSVTEPLSLNIQILGLIREDIFLCKWCFVARFHFLCRFGKLVFRCVKERLL